MISMKKQELRTKEAEAIRAIVKIIEDQKKLESYQAQHPRVSEHPTGQHGLRL